MKFKDVFAAASLLAEKVAAETPEMILAVVPNGVPGAVAIARSRKIPVRGIEFNRQTGEVSVDTSSLSATSEIWVVDDGVESGKAATAIGLHLKSQGFEQVKLVVPVCAKDAIAQLQFVYSKIVAVETPLMTRALSWHYEELPNLDLSTAAEMLAELNQ